MEPHRPISRAARHSAIEEALSKYIVTSQQQLSSILSNEGIEPSMVVKEGQAVKVKFIGTDERGRFKFSLKAVNQETGEDISNGEYQQNEKPVANRSKSDYKKPRRGFENGRTSYARKEFVKKTNKRKVEKGDKNGKPKKKKGLLSSLLKRRK